MRTKEQFFIDATHGEDYFWGQIDALSNYLRAEKKSLWQRIKSWF